MKTASFLAGLVGVSAIAMLAIADERVAMPNPALTPGATATDDLSRICALGYAKAHRMPYGSHGEWLRYWAMMYEYNIPREHWKDYEDDDLVPIELGGDNYSLQNHWPQPWSEARRKDRLENEMHRQVCAGTRTLDNARQQMMTGAW